MKIPNFKFETQPTSVTNPPKQKHNKLQWTTKFIQKKMSVNIGISVVDIQAREFIITYNFYIL